MDEDREADDKEEPSKVPLLDSKDILNFLDQTKQPDAQLYEEIYISRFNKNSINAEIQYVHLKGVKDHYKHKGRWSWFLMGSIASMLIFEAILLILVGLGILDFSEYKWLLPTLLIQNLTQIVGLSVYAVKYLFSDISK